MPSNCLPPDTYRLHIGRLEVQAQGGLTDIQRYCSLDEAPAGWHFR